MKYIKCLFFCFISLFHSANINAHSQFSILPIDANSVTCISISTIDWCATGGIIYNRKYFDDIIENCKFIPRIHSGLRTADVTDMEFIKLFCSIINTNLEKNMTDHKGIRPYDVIRSSDGFKKEDCIRGYYYRDSIAKEEGILTSVNKGDYMETRGKITFYMSNHTKIQAFIAHHYIDIENESFIMPQELMKFLFAFSGCGYIPEKDIQIANPNSIDTIKLKVFNPSKIQLAYDFGDYDYDSYFNNHCIPSNQISKFSINTIVSSDKYFNLLFAYVFNYGIKKNHSLTEKDVRYIRKETDLRSMIEIISNNETLLLYTDDKYLFYDNQVFTMNSTLIEFLKSLYCIEVLLKLI